MPDHPTPAEIRRYYFRMLGMLDRLRGEIESGAQAPPDWIGLTSLEIHQRFARLGEELRHEAFLAMIASFEAILQTDLASRVERRKKDPHSKRFRKLWHSAPARKRTTAITIEATLHVWKRLVGARELIGHFNQAVQMRHWIAHGRYWSQKSGLQSCDPEDAWLRGIALLRTLPGLDSIAAEQQAEF